MNKTGKFIQFTLITAIVAYMLVIFFINQNSYQSDRFTLQERWRSKISTKIQFISLADDGNVLVYGRGLLYKINAKSGDILWKYDSGSSDFFSNPPISTKNLIFIVIDNSLFAINGQTGTLFWKQSLQKGSNWVVDATDSVVLVNLVGSTIEAFDAQTGLFLWQQPVDRGLLRAYIANDIVYIPGYSLRAFDVVTGKVNWIENDKEATGYTAFYDGVIYSKTGAYDLINHRELWNTNDSYDGIVHLFLERDTLFIADSKDICAKNIQNGKTVWCAKVHYPRIPSIVKNIVYVFNGNHKLITAIDFSSGQIIGELSISNMNFFSTDQQLMVGSSDILYFSSGNQLFAFGE